MEKKMKHPGIILLILLSVLAGSIILPYILTDTPMILGWDMRTQYSSFYENLRTMFLEMREYHTLPFYSWAAFLGNNFWGSKLFYYHDVFDYLTLLIFPMLDYNHALMVQIFSKLIIAGLSFFQYARYHKFESETCIMGSLLFAFSSYSLEALKDPFFLSFYIFIPLYFLMMDKYLMEKKKLGYVLITAFLAVTNYYHFYSLSVFSVIYFVYRYVVIYGTAKGFLKEALPLIGCYSIAVMMSSFALIPEFFNIMTNQRIGKSSAFLFYDSIRTYFYILTGLFFPSSIVINRNNEFQSLYTVVSQNNAVLYVCLWAGSFCSLLLPQILSRKKENHPAQGLLLTMLILMLVPFGSSLMHGFSEPAFRWFEFPVFMNLILILPLIDNLQLVSKTGMKITLMVVSMLLLLGTPILGLLTGTEFSSYSKEYFLILTSLPLLWIGYFVLLSEKRKLLIVFCSMEILVVSYLSVYGNSYYRQFDKEMINGVTHVLQNRDDLNQTLLQLDTNNAKEFYRIYVDPSSVYWDYSTNLNLNFNVMGLMTYDSTVSSSITDMNEIVDIESYLPWSYEIRNPYLVDFLCTKYAVVTDASQLPHKDYKKVGEFNYLQIYENQHEMKFVRSYNRMMTMEEKTGRAEDILTTLIVHDEDRASLENIFTPGVNVDSTYTNRRGNQLYFDVEATDSTVVSIPVPFDKGWNIKIDGQNDKIYSVNGGMIGFKVPEGYHEVSMVFIPQGFKVGCLISGIGIVLFILLSALAYKRKSRDSG